MLSLCSRPVGYGVWAEQGVTVPLFLEYDVGGEQLSVLVDRLAGYHDLFAAIGQVWPVLSSVHSTAREAHLRRLLAATSSRLPVATTARDLAAVTGRRTEDSGDHPRRYVPGVGETDGQQPSVAGVAAARRSRRFVLYGQSWGGILAVEYALTYQQHLRGLVISNMMASVPAYNEYAERVLMPQMDQAALAEIKQLAADGKTEDSRYMELLMEHHYVDHVLRMPSEDWPEPVQRGFAHTNQAIYVSMQGPSELGISRDAKLAHWDRAAELASIEVPALVVGAQHDTMDPAHMEMMARRLPQGRYLHCPDGSHLAMYDDQQVYFDGLIDFLRQL